MLTKRKFLALDRPARHKYCAQLLRSLYETALPDLTEYNRLADLLNLNPYSYTTHRALADRYHWHLQQAGLSLKEHHFLPALRTQVKNPPRSFGSVAVYFDGVRSAYNVANILRTVEALRLGPVYFSPKTPYITDPKVARISQGIAELVPTFQNALLEDLPRPLIALDTSDSAVSVHEFVFPQSFTLIVGNEETGISPETLSQIDSIVEIPLYGESNCINAACAFSIAASKIFRA